MIRIKSMSEDAVFVATAGLNNHQKHLMLGIALKGLTGSRKVIEIMNRLGHCASYHIIEEVETDGGNIRISKAKLSDSNRNEAQSPLRNRCSVG